MERREVGSTLERRWEHRYQIPLLLALLLLLLEARLPDRRRATWLARVLPVALAVLGATPARATWLDRDALPRAAARLHDAGDFDGAAGKYNEALIDEPDGVMLHYNLGAAEYRRDDWEAATRAFSAVLADDPDGPLAGRAAYNLGNARYRQGEGAAGTDPKVALTHWGEALVAYRVAMTAAPDFEDPKYNYEFVQRKIDELRQQQEQEEQQEQQEQEEQQNQEQPQEQQDPQDQAEQQEEEPQQEEQPQGEQPQEQAQQDQPQEPEPQERPEPQAAPDAEPPRDSERMTPDEASALLDAGQDEELTPEEMNRGAVTVGDVPLKDW
jgi:Ca-activated chloride channel family protein